MKYGFFFFILKDNLIEQFMRLFIKTIFWCLPLGSFSQVNQKAIVLKRFIEKTHFKPRAVDDSFSLAIFDKMIEELDYYKLYFTESQIKELEKYRFTIDDELNGQPGSFCKDLALTFYSAQEQGENIGKELLQHTFNYQKQDVFRFGKEAAFSKDLGSLKNRWQGYLTWRIMVRLNSRWEMVFKDSAGAKLPETTSAWFKKEEEDARRQIRKRVEQQLAQHAKGGLSEMETMIEAWYLRTIANTFDPHTDYFDSRAKQEFSESLSTDVLLYGFSFEETDQGEFQIAELAPGGAAWNTGSIYQNDKILQIKTKSGKVLKSDESNYNEISDLLKEQGKEEIEMTLRSADGNTRLVKLQKQEVKNEENIVRGYLLEGEKKVGYIALPSFYTNWGDNNGSGCANDLSKEIVKLKREKIDGLILDLRYNGGGSVQEAIEIAGIFIEAGPMGIVKETGSNSITLKDPSRGSIYDGPLLVLVNGQSASASELVAATLQDYNRGIIMGSPTFGKATMQVMLPLDTTLVGKDGLFTERQGSQKKYSDYAKVTIGKIYRINGSTNQLNGVIPDITLPDAFESLSITERSLPFALPADTTTKKVDFNPVRPGLPKDKFPELQQQVIQGSYFTALENWVADMKKRNKENKVPLDWNSFVKFEQATTPPNPEANADKKIENGFISNNTSFTKRLLELDNSYQQETNSMLLQNLNKDPILQATFNVLIKIQ
jgi:carboxyl-terminal processing protease